MPGDDLTSLLKSWRGGDRQVLDSLVPLLYDELARIAQRAMSGERSDHTLQTRALVHEAYLRLIDADVAWQDRAHFFAVAARTMRRVLINHAKSRGRLKRGGDAPVRVDLTDIVDASAPVSVDVLALDEALDRLAQQDSRTAQLVELHFYGGMSYEEVAQALDISPATVGRDLRFAKAWLGRELGMTSS
jgi:RNA polymerase sigma factor (TIGR02999 family)